MTADNNIDTHICGNCLSLKRIDGIWPVGVCQNASSDHYMHVLDIDHPQCERVTWREGQE